MHEQSDQAPPLTLLDLGDDILGAIFAHLVQPQGVHDPVRGRKQQEPRRVLPLVCRRFLKASQAAVALWRCVQLNLLTLSAERVPAFVRWLEAHAPAIHCLVLHGRALPSVDAALAQHADALAAALQRATRCERLALPLALSVRLLARLRPLDLPRLRAVSVDLAGGRGGGGGFSEAQQRATLNLLLLPGLEQVAVQSCLEAQLLAASPHAWPRLQHLHFADVRDVPRASLLPPLARFAALTSLRFSQRDGFALPGPLTALRRLAHLHAAVRYRDDPLRVDPQLSLLTSLRALWVQHASFEASAAVAQLPRLHTLALVGSADGWAAVLEGFAAAGGGGGGGDSLPPCRLRALHLEAHATPTAEVPAAAWDALAALPAGLTRLELPFNRLRQLSPGPYLAELQALDLSQNSLEGVPAALAACTALSALSLGQQEAAAPGGAAGDVALLGALPSLQVLVTSAGHYSGPHLATGLRSPAEAAHLSGLQAALPPHVRVSNVQADWERAVGQLAALFEVRLRR